MKNEKINNSEKPEERKEEFEKWKRGLEARAEEFAAAQEVRHEKELMNDPISQMHFERKDKEIIEDMRKKGWRIVDVLTNEASVNAEDVPENEEVRIIGMENRFLVFKRQKKF